MLDQFEASNHATLMIVVVRELGRAEGIDVERLLGLLWRGRVARCNVMIGGGRWIKTG